MTLTTNRAEVIRKLNDAFRTTFQGGRVMMTASINALPPADIADILEAVRTFTDFNEDNDPHGERDCAFFEEGEHRCFWKIDLYDKNMEYGSEDPTNPEVTTRVLTVGLSSDY